MAAPLNKVYGVRYFTYELHFPKDKDYWVDQVPFVEHLDWVLKNKCKFPPQISRALMLKGEAHWKDQNGVTHRIKIDDHIVPRRWGTKDLKFKFTN